MFWISGPFFGSRRESGKEYFRMVDLSFKSLKNREVGPTLLKCNSEGLNYTKIQQFKIQSMHQDIVSKLPQDWVILASSDKCEAQFAVYKDRYLCLQGHPEFTRDMVEKIVSVRKSLWTSEFTSQVLENLEKQVFDSSVILDWIMEFLGISKLGSHSLTN